MARGVVALAMLAQAAFVLFLTRDQWFETDALQYIVTRGGDPETDLGLMVPYGGHWQVIPILLFRAVFGVAGGTYWPYVVMALAIHFALCWALLELLLRSGARPVIAVVSVWVLLFYGQGADVYMSDAPFPLSLATALSAWAAFALLRTDFSRAGVVVAAVLLLAAVMTSGAGIAGAVLVVALTFFRGHRRPAVLVAVPAAAVFLAWYVAYGRDGGRVRPISVTVLDIPEWLWIGLPGALERAFGVPSTGVFLLVGLVVALVLPGLPRELRVLGAAGLVAAAAQMSLSAIGAIVMGPETALTGRYTYLAMSLLTPALACALTQVWSRIRSTRSEQWLAPLAVAVVIVPVTAQALRLQTEQADGRRLFSKVYRDWVQGAIDAVDDGEAVLTDTPDDGFNRNIDITVLTSDRLRPRLELEDVSAKTRLDAENRFMVQVGSEDPEMFRPAFVGVSGFDESGASEAGCTDLDALLLQDQVVKMATGTGGNEFGMISDSTKVTTRLRRGDVVSDPTTWDVSQGPVYVATSAKDAVLEVVFDADGQYTLCHQ